MRTRWIAVLSAVGIGVSLLILSVGVSANPPVPWGLDLPVTQVPVGDFLPVLVTGPSNGSFYLNVNAQPFNQSYPLFHQRFTLPVNSSGISKLNLSLPTGEYDVGGYQVGLELANATLVQSQVVLMISAVNESYLSAQIIQLQEQIYVEQQALMNAQQGLATQRANTDLFGIVAVASSALALTCTLSMVWTWLERRGNLHPKRVRRLLHSTLGQPIGGAGPDPSDFGPFYRLRCCRKADVTEWWNARDVRQHLAIYHRNWHPRWIHDFVGGYMSKDIFGPTPPGVQPGPVQSSGSRPMGMDLGEVK